MAEINIDANLIKSSGSLKQESERMVELHNGCICCTLREDLLEGLAGLASSQQYDYCIIESSGISEPMPVAETFTFTDEETGVTLGDIATLDTLVTVVDGHAFTHELESVETLRTRNWHADEEDERTISHLLCDQVEFANVVVLNKTDLMTSKEQKSIHDLISKMNPSARVVEASYGKVPCKAVLSTGAFELSEAEKHEMWLKEARVGEHKPESIEYGVGSFVFKSKRPFHPRRLWDALEAIESKSMPFESVVRAKGTLWLATRQKQSGIVSVAGRLANVSPGPPWWAGISKSQWPEDIKDEIKPLWDDEHGDRHQSFVVIGTKMDKVKVEMALTECLLTDEEMKLGLEVWAQLEDPFIEAGWNRSSEEDDHDQESESHSHSHKGHAHH